MATYDPNDISSICGSISGARKRGDKETLRRALVDQGKWKAARLRAQADEALASAYEKAARIR